MQAFFHDDTDLRSLFCDRVGISIENKGIICNILAGTTNSSKTFCEGSQWSHFLWIFLLAAQFHEIFMIHEERLNFSNISLLEICFQRLQRQFWVYFSSSIPETKIAL